MVEMDRKQERDLFGRRNYLYKSRIKSFQFYRVLTDAGGTYKTSQSTMHFSVVFNFIKCTFIVVYYDDDMTECTDDSHSVELFFFLLLLGNSIRKLKVYCYPYYSHYDY